MKILLTVYMSFGRGWKGSGMQWTSLFVRDWLRVYLGMLQQYWKPREDTPNTSLWHFFTFKSWATKPFQWCACTNYVIMFPNLDVISHKYYYVKTIYRSTLLQIFTFFLNLFHDIWMVLHTRSKHWKGFVAYCMSWFFENFLKENRFQTSSNRLAQDHQLQYQYPPKTSHPQSPHTILYILCKFPFLGPSGCANFSNYDRSTLGYPISGPIRLNNFSLRINLIACFRVGSQVFGPFLWQMVQGHLYFGPDHPTLSHSVWGLKTILGPKAAKNWLQSAISIQMCYFNSRRLYMGSGEQ